MTKQNEGVSTGTAAAAPVNYSETAQERILALKQWREQIPRFATPTTADETRRLSAAAAIPPEFIELTNVAVANHKPLERVESATPAEVRDLVTYADAFEPLAAELEALAQFLRYSTTFARNKAAHEALTTYALATRLAKRPETAYLAPRVADMRRALGRDRKLTPEEAARRAAERAEKAAARVAKARAALQPDSDPAPQE